MGAAVSLKYRGRWRQGGTWSTFPGLQGFDVQLVSSASAEGLAFGSAVSPRATIRADASTLASAWDLAAVQLEASIDNGATWKTVFRGVLTEQADDGLALTYTAGGADELIRRAEVRSDLLYRRAVATATTAISLDDPDDPDYQGGLLNLIAWRAGGRPLLQALSYSTADFYYHFDESTFTPEWSWVEGEDAWAEALALVQAAGGQLYQDQAGTLRYIQPLSLGETSGSPFTYTPSIYGRASTRRSSRRAPTAVLCRYQRRALQPLQEIYKDETPQTIPPANENGGQLDVDLAMQWPIWRYDSIDVNIVDYAGRKIGYCTVTTLQSSAQLVKIRITNPGAQPLLATSITVNGNPVTVTEEGTASYEGPLRNGRRVVQRVADSIYIQNPDDARRTCRVLYDFYGTPRDLITLAQCPYNPDRFVGEYVLYTAPARRGSTTKPCRVTNIRYSRSGAVMDVDLTPVDGLPTRSQLFRDGIIYADSDVRLVGY